VDVNFTFSPDFNQTLTVQPDGFVALKGAGTLLAEGLTVPQMQQAVAYAYRSFLHEPEVTVTLAEGLTVPQMQQAVAMPTAAFCTSRRSP
jgi:polysaccharide export outer membrane protein